MLGVVLLLTLLANTLRLAKLPLRTLLKDELGLDPEQVATFFAVAGVAWYVKPLAGLLSDHVPFYGSRRRSYLLLSGAGGALAWLVSGLASHSSNALLVTLVSVNLFAVLGNTAAGGLLVDAGRDHKVMPLLSAVRLAAMNLGALLAGPIGGWLAAGGFVWTSLTGALMMLLMVVIAFSLKGETPRPPSQFSASLLDLGLALRNRRIWSVATLNLGFYLAPGYQTLWFFHQRDVLGLTVQEIGLLEGMQALGGIAGAACYALWSRRIALRNALLTGILLSGACVGLYSFYDSFAAGLVLEPLVGLCVCVGVLPLCELTARACPPRHEAFVFAVIFGLGNAGIALSDVLGTWISQRFGFDLAGVFSVYALGTAGSAVLVRMVPPSLLESEC